MVILQLPAKLESEPSLTTGAGSACGTVQHVDGKRIEDLVIRTCRKAHQKTKSIIYSYSIFFSIFKDGRFATFLYANNFYPYF